MAYPEISSLISQGKSIVTKAFAPTNRSVIPTSSQMGHYKAFISCQDKNIAVSAYLPEQVMLDVSASYEAPYQQGIDTGKASDMLRMAGMTLTTKALTLQIWQGGAHINFTLPFILQAETGGREDVLIPIKDLLKLTMPKENVEGGMLEAPGPHVDTGKFLAASSQAVATGAKNAVTKISNGDAKTAGASIFSNTVDFFKNAANALTTGGSMVDTSKMLTQGVDAAKKFADTTISPISKALINSIKNNITLKVGNFLMFPSVVITDVSPTYDVVLDTFDNPVRATVNVSFRTLWVPTQQDIEDMFPTAKSIVSTSRASISA